MRFLDITRFLFSKFLKLLLSSAIVKLIQLPRLRRVFVMRTGLPETSDAPLPPPLIFLRRIPVLVPRSPHLGVPPNLNGWVSAGRLLSPWRLTISVHPLLWTNEQTRNVRIQLSVFSSCNCLFRCFIFYAENPPSLQLEFLKQSTAHKRFLVRRSSR